MWEQQQVSSSGKWSSADYFDSARSSGWHKAAISTETTINTK